LSLIALVFALTGCYGPDNFKEYDVTFKPSWWGQLHRDEILETDVDMLVQGRKLSPIVPVDPGNSPDTVTVTMYKRNPDQYHPKIKLAPKGTKIRCANLKRFFSPQTKTLYVLGEILDGECKGAIVCVPGAHGNPKKSGSLVLEHFYVHIIKSDANQ
jgi:hypothetical protein